MDSVRDWLIEAESPAPHLIRLWPLGKRQYSGTSAFLELSAYELVPSPDELSVDDNLQVTIELTRRGVLPTNSSRLLNFDGTIQKHGEPEPPLKWEHNGSESEMFVRYTYERALASGDAAYLQVERPCIVQKRRITSQTSLHETLEAIQSEIYDYLLITSLISRESIDWYQIEVFGAAQKGQRNMYRGALRQTITERPSTRHEWPLIEYNTLEKGLFQRMVTSLQQSSAKDALRRSISFEVASWTQRGLENSFIFCQAALEAVIGALDEEVAFLDQSSIPWNKISKALAATLKAIGKEENLSKTFIDLAKKKLPELKRAPIADQIIFHANRLSIQIDDLWPSSIGFEEGLRSSLRQRNLLVHAAHIEDPNEAYGNLVRMRVLTERFILASLGAHQEEIGWTHDQAVRFVNRAHART
jgi:hypothetical protein